MTDWAMNHASHSALSATIVRTGHNVEPRQPR